MPQIPPPPQLALVTGATGFVGAALVRRLLAEGIAVRVMTRKGSDRRNIEGLNVEIVEGDLLQPSTLSQAVAGCDALFHVAADYRIWVPDPETMNRANIQGTTALLKAAHAAGVKRMVYTSSVAVLGLNADGTPADENTPVTLDNMVGVYKRSKFLAEQEVRKLIAALGLDCVIVNPSTPIGPRDIKPTPTGRMIVEAASGKMPAYVDTGLNIVHVDDVAMGHWLAYQKGQAGQRYILGGENLGLGEILAEIAALTGRKAPTLTLPITPLMPLAYAAEFISNFTKKEPFITRDGLKMARKKMFFTSEKAEHELGYQHRPAHDALADAIAWFKEQGYCP